MKILDKTGIVTTTPDETRTWQVKICGVVIFSWYYAEEIEHVLEKYEGRKIRIRIELIEE